MSLQVYFQPADTAQLAAFATAVSTPGSVSYHHFLSVSQFAARFGPSDQTVSALDKYLRSEGLSVGRLSANRLAQNVTGTSAEVQRAFEDPLLRFRTAGGAQVIGSAFSPKLPAGLAGFRRVGGRPRPLGRPFQQPGPLGGHIAGKAAPEAAADKADKDGSAADAGPLHQDGDVETALTHPGLTHPGLQAGKQAGPQDDSACSGMAGQGLTPAQLDSAYGLTGFGQRGIEGQGETIGLIEYGLADTPAVAGFQACTGSSLSIGYVPASSAPTQVDTEVAADLEVIAALAPKANVVVYESSQQGTDLAPWDMAVSGTAAGGLPEVISDSWGSCEQDTGMASAYYQIEEALYEEAAAQGQTVLVASGDDGSEGCLDQTQAKGFAVYDPASAPFVTAVGGTASDKPSSPQYIWNSRKAVGKQCLHTECDLYGASGGGRAPCGRGRHTSPRRYPHRRRARSGRPAAAKYRTCPL